MSTINGSAGWSRRDVARAGLLGGLLGAASWPLASQAAPSRTRVLRVAHLTDVHIQKAKGGADGLAACLKHLQEQADPPQLVLFGGDNLMNVDGAKGAETAQEQLDLWKSVLKQECSLPYRIAIGNHDILRNDPVDGKKWAVDAFGLPERYYAFEQSGWKFIVLDSTEPSPSGGYKARMDEAQFTWLGQELAKTPASTPVCLLSHIPILGVSVFFDGECEKSGDWKVPGAWMHIDARRLKNLFRKHPQVKLAVSGHIHLVDDASYLGVRYACNGAVSGSWWGGSFHEFAPSYALIDLNADGTSAIQTVEYGWTPRA